MARNIKKSNALYMAILLNAEIRDALNRVKETIGVLEHCDEETDFAKTFNCYEEKIPKYEVLTESREVILYAIDALCTGEKKLSDTIDFFYRVQEDLNDALSCFCI